MPQLNYKHLHYFWAVAKEGTVADAAKLLHVTPQTISGQLRTFEEQIGASLFRRAGRKLVLTEMGRIALSYAGPMFELANELSDVLRDGVIRQSVRFNVGVAMVVPKLIAYRILAPALQLKEQFQIICHEAPLDTLLGDMAVHKLDLLITDAPMRPGHHVRAYSHLLGESGLTFFADRRAAVRYRRNFPGCLDSAPFLFPSETSALRNTLEKWLSDLDLRPRLVAEFEDTALMNAFGEAGAGVFALPTAIENDVRQKYRVTPIGQTLDVRQRFYAISPERKLKHPSVIAITNAARTQLFK